MQDRQLWGDEYLAHHGRRALKLLLCVLTLRSQHAFANQLPFWSCGNQLQLDSTLQQHAANCHTAFAHDAALNHANTLQTQGTPRHDPRMLTKCESTQYPSKAIQLRWERQLQMITTKSCTTLVICSGASLHIQNHH